MQRGLHFSLDAFISDLTFKPIHSLSSANKLTGYSGRHETLDATMWGCGANMEEDGTEIKTGLEVQMAPLQP